jgi:hypothetical protein
VERGRAGSGRPIERADDRALRRDVAGPTLDEVQAKLDPEELASARQATAGPKLDKLVSKMLARGKLR